MTNTFKLSLGLWLLYLRNADEWIKFRAWQLGLTLEGEMEGPDWPNWQANSCLWNFSNYLFKSVVSAITLSTRTLANASSSRALAASALAALKA